MKERLLQIEGVEDSYEIVVPGSNGLIKGHPDFRYFRCPGDCKSYLKDEHIPDERNIPAKIYFQLNAYMFYDNSNMAYIVCESRESGMLKVLTVRRNAGVCDKIDRKVQDILQQLKQVA